MGATCALHFPTLGAHPEFSYHREVHVEEPILLNSSNQQALPTVRLNRVYHR